MIRQPVINTLNRIGIPWEKLSKIEGKVSVSNRFSGESCETTPLIAFCIAEVYRISNEYESIGGATVKLSDFDRLRHYILEVDSNAYMTCID